MIHFPQWGCFFDFHTMPSCPQVGENFDIEQFISELKSAKVDFIVFPARCNLGMAYYDTQKGIRHPSLKYDLFGKILKACHAAGIRCSAYLNVGLSHEEGLRHRDWLTISPDGAMYQSDRMNNFFRRMCYNSAYANHFCDMVKELTDEYAPDGFFFDCTTVNPCVGGECIQEMKARGLDWQDEKVVFEFARFSLERFCQRLAKQVKEANPDLLVYFNGLTFQKQADMGNYLEFEALGRAIYDSLPTTAHYARKLNKPVLNMIGRFHKSWADFGGICSPDALEYFLAYGLANTMRCTVGDHFHPRGDIQKPVFDLIRTVYGKLQRFSDCYQNAEAVCEFALLTPEYAFDYSTCDGQKALFALFGAALMFDQMHLLYDIITPGMDFSKYRVLVLLDESRIDPQIAARIQEFLQNGGKVFCCGQGGLALDSEQLLLPLPAQCLGKSPCNPAYISVKPGICPAFPEMPMTLYDAGMSYRPLPGAEILGSIIKPMLQYGWDGEHGNYYTPPDKENGDAAIIECENGIIFSHPLFQTYRECSQPHFLQLTKALLKRLLPEAMLEIRNFPSYCRATLTRQKERLHLHLLNFHPESPSPSVVQVDTPSVLSGIEVRLNRQANTPARIYLADSGKNLRWQKIDNQIQFEIDHLQGYQVVTIEFS